MFANRNSAGDALARALAAMDLESPVVLALARGGIPVGARIARRLGCPLDVLLVRKIGVPYQPELAAAAVVDGEAPEIVLNEDVMRAAGLRQSDIDVLAEPELREIDRRRKLYLGNRRAPEVTGRTAILVDDGIATGASMRAAMTAVRRRKPKTLIVATPVAPADTVQQLETEADRVVCLRTPRPFLAIGPYYLDFHQLADDEIVRLLADFDHGTYGDADGSAASAS